MRIDAFEEGREQMRRARVGRTGAGRTGAGAPGAGRTGAGRTGATSRAAPGLGYFSLFSPQFVPRGITGLHVKIGFLVVSIVNVKKGSI